MAIQIREAGERSALVFQNESAQERKDARLNGENKEQVKNGSINMNELDGKLDSILMRKQRAQNKALKVIGDAWAAEKKIDQDIAERRSHVQELQDNIDENMDIIDANNAHKAELQETYSVSADGQEQKDLELMEKAGLQYAIASGNPEQTVGEAVKKAELLRKLDLGALTQEEQERLAEIADKPFTEYQRRALNIDSENTYFQKKIDNAKDEMKAEYGAIRAIRQERLKSHGMADAKKEAEEIMADAGKDIIDLLTGEAQDHIDETLEEKREEAEEKAEEKEEQQEKIDESKAEKEAQQEKIEIKQEENRDAAEIKAEQREKAKEQEDLLHEIGESLPLPTATPAQARAAIKEMLQRMKLLEEDLKGAKVDEKTE